MPRRNISSHERRKNATKKRRKNKNKNKNNRENQGNNNTEKKTKHLFGKVYAEWCGACKALKPKWDTMVNQLKTNTYLPKEEEQQISDSTMVHKNGIVLEIIEINSGDYDNFKTKYSNVLGDLNANGYPTIFRKISHSPVEYYQGDRSPEDLIAWALNETRKEKQNMGGSKRYHHQKHNNTLKNNHNKSFSQRIADFWGWK